MTVHTYVKRENSQGSSTLALTPRSQENVFEFLAALASALKEAQAGYRVRTLTVDDVHAGISRAERDLAFLPKKHWEGVHFTLAPWDAGSKRNPNRGTLVNLCYTGGAWRMTKIDRYYWRSESLRFPRAMAENAAEVLTSILNRAGIAE